MAPRSRRDRRGWRWRRCRPSNGATPPPFRVFYNYIHFFSFVFCCFSFFFFFFGTQFYRVLLFFYYGTGLETFRFLLALELVVIFSPVSSTHILLWGTRCNDTRNGSYRVLLACTRFFCLLFLSSSSYFKCILGWMSSQLLLAGRGRLHRFDLFDNDIYFASIKRSFRPLFFFPSFFFPGTPVEASLPSTDDNSRYSFVKRPFTSDSFPPVVIVLPYLYFSSLCRFVSL